MSTTFCIGLTGGIASGKSTVEELFATHDIDIVDADLIAHTLTQPNTPTTHIIAQHFGPQITQADGSLDRAAIKQIIFNHPRERHWLETLLHPLIREQMDIQIAKATSPYVLAVIPLLAESLEKGFDFPWLDRILLIDCSLNIQKERLKQRDQLNKTTINQILQAQASPQQRRAIADDVITNDDSLQTLSEQVNKQHELYLKYAKSHREQ